MGKIKERNTATGIPRTISKGPTFMSLESSKEKRLVQKKRSEEIMAKKLPKFGERRKSTDSRSSAYQKQRKLKETPRNMTIKYLECKVKENILNIARKKKKHTAYEETMIQMTVRFSSETMEARR